MSRSFLYAAFVLIAFFVGCAKSTPVIDETGKKAEEERVAQDKAANAKKLRDKLADEARLDEELKKDFEQLQGHWDHPGSTGSSGKPLPAIHLEIDATNTAYCRIVLGSVESATQFHFMMTADDGQRFIKGDAGSTGLSLTPLGYRLDGDTLYITGSATDPILGSVDLSGVLRRTDWTQQTEAEIAHVLKKLDAELTYDDGNPTKPIVKVAFHFQAPVHNVHLRIFAGLKNLQELDLSEATNVNDTGLRHLAGLKQLHQLNVTNLQTSTEAVQQLAQELPNCRIIRR